MAYESVLRENRQRSKMQTSPLMFESDDEDSEAVDDSANSSNKENESVLSGAPESTKEERIVKGLQTVLMGIPPPPAFTVPQLDCREILKLWREHQAFNVMLSPEKYKKNKDASSKMEEEVKTTKWPDTLQLDYWDVYYNRSSASEELERLSVRYKERYVGAETSSCINALFAKSPTRTASARKRARHRAWGHSPGRRLSHLARRRKAFSSASLCSVAGNNNPDKKMIMVEIKKIGNRQKKKGSVKKTKPTPKKKKESQASTYKRALFQSPDQDPMKAVSKTPSTQCVQRSKRTLFADSSEKKNEFGKRERPAATRVSPRKRVNRSLSFQESSQPPAAAPAPPTVQPQPAQTLSGAHKQKMLWAATNALREEGMGMSHELFRPCMTVLFRTCQRLWLTKAGAGLHDAEGSTSERMLALAKQFSSFTIREISLDPTSEHMALVYNNSLKMAEEIFNQPCRNQVISSSVICESKKNSDTVVMTSKSNFSKQNMRKTDNNTTELENDCRANGNSSRILDTDSSSVLTKTEINTSVRKNTRGNTIEQDLNVQLINPIKNTPSKVNLRESQRSSPRLARKVDLKDGLKVKGSVCNALFSTEINYQTCEKGEKEVYSHENETNKNVPNSEHIKLDVSGSNVPLKEATNLICPRRRSCKLNDSSLVVANSLLKNHSNEELPNEHFSNADVVQPECNLDKNEKEQNRFNAISSENSFECPSSKSSNPQNKLTPTKKVSFNATSLSKLCHVSLSDVKTKKHYDSLANECNQSTTTHLHCDTISIQNSASNTDVLITEPSVGQRVTRSRSTETKAYNKKLVHHLFSPPTKQLNKPLDTEGTNKEVTEENGSFSQTSCSEAQQVAHNVSESLDLPLEEPHLRVTRRTSDEKRKNSQSSCASTARTLEENENNVLPKDSNPVKHIDGFDLEFQKSSPLKLCDRHRKSPKKKIASRRSSRNTASTDSVHSSVSCTSSQSCLESNNDASVSSPQFVSPRTRLRKSQINNQIRVSSCKTTPEKSLSSPDFLSPVVQLRKATLNQRTSVVSSSGGSSKSTPNVLGSPEFLSPVVKLRKATINKRISVASSDASPSKDTKYKSIISEEEPSDTEQSSETVIYVSGKSSNNSEDYETNKENVEKERPVNGCSNKKVEFNINPSHRSSSSKPNPDEVKCKFDLYPPSLQNTPTHKVVAEEPASRMLQLYRLSMSGGDGRETEKLLPEVICLEPPKLVPHWAARVESEESQASPPSLTPHWEQESCSGTSTSLPESIMAHWHQLSAKANDDSSDKVMFDFEDTSYEITFPSANEDSRASSICAPIDFPFVDDSKSGFNNVFRRSSSELSDK